MYYPESLIAELEEKARQSECVKHFGTTLTGN